ncbi:hypothetical protein J3D55_000496 [Chryseobacterium ginsenosidimutans]|uniref:hypothetical protein n=1 Tax=Chryseobacterium ginsenosidimutans TaxID=687846 RepID=UPI002166DC87|nr:hypothetical protein [Chryseobacterium ginsenosidimutans]MCS3867580.1 hypothetical protein [Chryseobacterium ginsenosidimutans]
MLQLILMLLGMAFGHNNANTSSCNHDNNGQPTTQLTNPGGGTDPGTGTDPGDGTGGPGNGGSTGGNTGQNPPPFTQP